MVTAFGGNGHQRVVNTPDGAQQADNGAVAPRVTSSTAELQTASCPATRGIPQQAAELLAVLACPPRVGRELPWQGDPERESVPGIQHPLRGLHQRQHQPLVGHWLAARPRHRPSVGRPPEHRQ